MQELPSWGLHSKMFIELNFLLDQNFSVSGLWLVISPQVVHCTCVRKSRAVV